ncbi:unnamed protein product [Cladocopium goreaui]|uniref:Uncharacterized protein n=1 Tax=Cladocopium goreaui TaxID=2562237 RepID=A0A9P1FDQ5_9DINO|nr:unnamed protein product [Cladocopium goreaui]
MGLANSTSKQFATSFGEEETVGRRGPTLGSVLIDGVEAGSFRLVVVTPLKIQVYDAHTAKILDLQDLVPASLRSHLPMTSFSVEAESSSSRRMAVGCQDGEVLIFSLESDTAKPLRSFHVEEDLTSESKHALAKSILALHLHQGYVFAGTCGRCMCWNLDDGELLHEFHLPSSDHPVSASSLVTVAPESGLQLWTGLDVGSVAVFEVETGMLVRSLPCGGPEMVVALAFCEKTSVVFALSAHRRVTIWDTDLYACLQKYPAELMTCGADLSAMGAFDIPSINMSLLVLAGVDGSLCLRRITRREDRKLNCILLWYLGAESGCPITALDFHRATETILLGDAGCRVQLQNIKEQISEAQMIPPRKSTGPKSQEAEAETTTVDIGEDAEPPLPAPAYPPSPSQVSPAGDARTARTEKKETAPGYPSADSAAFPVFNGGDAV